MSLSIGILVQGLQDVSNGQLRIVEEILNNPHIEVVLISSRSSLVVLDKKDAKHNFFKELFSGISLANGVLRLQIWLEERIFFRKPDSTKKNDIIRLFGKVQTIKVDCSKQTGVNFFIQKDIKKIENANLDLIINLRQHPIIEEISTIAKYGVWDFLFMDVKRNKRGSIGFWEVLNKHEGIGFSLAQLTSNDTKKQIIDTAFFNRGWSLTETRNIVHEGAVSVFSKAVRNLVNGRMDFTESDTITIPKYLSVTLSQVLRYCFGFNLVALQKIGEKLGNVLFSLRPERWSLFLGTGPFMNAVLSSSEPLEIPSNEFWADPFLFTSKGETYVFFENYSYRTKRGKISCRKIKGTKLLDIVDVLDLEYHLSFPYIFEENGEIFLMPETSENERLELYRGVSFPVKWELYATAFEGETVADAFFYTDEDHEKWLFLNKQVMETAPMNSELYIYNVDSLKFENLQPHSQNPVIIDARVARIGGAVFKHAGERYRPSQRNVDAIYGRALNINKIEKLSIQEYSERTERVVRPSFDKNLMTMHHLHQLDGLFIFDAAYKIK